MKTVAFIPARSGSTRLKNKNIKLFNKKPLIYWTLKKAIESNLFQKIIFSSDSKKYYKILIKYLLKDNLIKHKEEIIFDQRKKEFSKKKSKIFDYIKHEFIKKFEFTRNTLIVQLLPTAPLREVKTLRKAILEAKNHRKNIFSASEYDFHLKFAFTKYKNNWKNQFKDTPMKNGNTQSQDQKTYYHPNGVINCLWTDFLSKKTKTIYDNAFPFYVSKLEALDIDTKDDFRICEALYKLKK